jgi:hypothetical protein
MAIVTLSVTGQILHPDGLTAATGTVTFQLPIELRDIVANIVYTPDTWTETLDVNGSFTFTGLIATDSPDVTPTDWMYRVHVNTDAYVASFSTSLPAALAPVAEFADLIPATTEPCTEDGTPCVTLAQLAALQAEVDAVEADVDAVQLDLASLNVEVDGLGATMTLVQADLSALNIEVDAIQTTFLRLPAGTAEQTGTWTATDEWLRIDTPFSAGDTNPDLLRIFNGAAKVQWWNGNGEHRAAPSTISRNGSRHFEFLDGSDNTFWSVSTNPANPALRVDLLHVNGTLEAVRPGWAVALNGVESPEYLQAGLSLLPSAWTVPAFPAGWGSSPTVSDGVAIGAVDPLGTQLIPALKRVRLRGVILNSTGGAAAAQTVFMTIDAAHRPASWKQFPGRTSTNLAVKITVKETGAVVVDQSLASLATLAFDGIEWDMP